MARYVHGPSLDEILIQQCDTNPTPLYLHTDALGSPHLVTDAAAAVVERYTYSAYGQVTAYDNLGATVGVPTTRFLYTGREWLAELALNEHRNRFYHPGLGRWLNRDPIGERGGLNLYAYGNGNPAQYTAPFGLLVPPAPPVIVAPPIVGVAVTVGIVAISARGYWQLGELIGEAIVDWSDDSEQICEDQYLSDIDSCNLICDPRARSLCFQRAMTN